MSSAKAMPLANTLTIDFDSVFEVLMGNPPFNWQRELYKRFVSDAALHNIPSSCNLPTGLGKTSVIAVWLIALASRPDRMPRRLVYVVNRRTVVDQTTDEVVKLRKNLALAGLEVYLKQLCATDDDAIPLALSTLRGQFADNREWSADPSRPAVICGTVDMIGSRLLFSGYGVGFRGKPLHAGFLGQDVLLVHDEAHLEPAFQQLIETIEREQNDVEHTGELPWPKLRVMALSATARKRADVATAILTLNRDDFEHPVVRKRIEAHKRLHLHSCQNETKGLVDQVVRRALEYKASGGAIIVFLRSVENALKVRSELEKSLPEKVASLTGTMRGRERDELVESNPVFARFMPQSDCPPDVTDTVYLVCTSAGEVGVNLSADHLVCDLSTFDSMAQRFGRVNRFGDRDDSCVDVVHPESFDDQKPNAQRKATLDLLAQLNGDASPKALDALPADARLAAFAPDPTILSVTDILFDAWALTTIRDKMPGRPPVEPYLHGLAEWEPARTSVAWREEVELIAGDLLERYEREDLLDDYPLKPHELLSDRTDRVLKTLQSMAIKHPAAPVWLIDAQGQIHVSSLGKVADPKATKSQEKKPLEQAIADGVVLLPPSIGGLSGGMLDGASDYADDVADIPDDMAEHRIRVMSGDAAYGEKTNGMRLVRSIELDADEDDEPQTWDWYKQKPLEGGRTAKKPVLWATHVGDVVREIDRILAGLTLPNELAEALRVAAKLHDHGKKRAQFQATLGNRDYPNRVLAKSGRAGARLPETYRHELGSLIDAPKEAEFKRLSAEMRDLVLHVIAAHHGRARPHFPMDEAYDPDHAVTITDPITCEVPRRFARLQRKYGRWGLAYLESLLRAADWAASAEPSAFETQATHQEVTR